MELLKYYTLLILDNIIIFYYRYLYAEEKKSFQKSYKKNRTQGTRSVEYSPYQSSCSLCSGSHFSSNRLQTYSLTI